MDLREAKKILNNRGFLLEDEKSNTKSLVFKFWKTRKEGKTLSNEEAEQLLNAPDFDTVVDPKYQNFIKSSLNKVLGNAPAATKKPVKGLFGSVEMYGQPNFAVLNVPVNTETNAKEEKQAEVKEIVNKIIDEYKDIKDRFKALSSESLTDDNLDEYNKLVYDAYLNSFNEHAFEDLRPYFIHVTPIYTARGHEFLYNHTTDVQYKKVCDKLDKYKLSYNDYVKIKELLLTNLQDLNYNVKTEGITFVVKGEHCTVKIYTPSSKDKTRTVMDMKLDSGVQFDVEKYIVDTFGENALYKKDYAVFTFARLRAAIDYMDEIYDGLKAQKDKDDKKRADEFKKWYDSLSDIARDQYNYYREHPNGNWSGD